MDTPQTKSSSNSLLRWIALLAWMLVALAYLAFFLAELGLDFAQLQAPCEGQACNYLAVSQAEADVLVSWGLSLRLYSVIVNGASILTVAIFWLLGTLILWRHASTRIGWAISLALIVIPITAISDADNLASSYPALLIPSGFLSLLGLTILLLFFYLFPNGRFYPRWAYIPCVVTGLLFYIYSLDTNQIIEIPLSVQQIIFLIIIFAFFLAGYFQLLRYRRSSTPIERQQTKWIIFGMFLFFFSFIFWFLFFGNGMEFSPGAPRLLASMGGWILILLVSISALPVTMAIAITRYRLWDIDLVIRRTLQYALLTGILAFVYLGSVVVLQSFVTAVGGQQSSAVIVISTLAIAALFNPLRKRIQDFLERRFYRTRYDAEHALTRFARTARDEVDMDILSAALVGLASETMQPSRVSLWLLEKTDNSS